jgi:hypothetical protein
MKIKLFDNREHLVDPLVKRMYNDTFYYGELSKLALSSSSIKLLLESPKKFYYVQRYGQTTETQAMRDGRLLHTLILEPDKFDNLHFVDVASKNSKAYKEAKKNYGEVYTRVEKFTAERLADAFLRNEKAISYLKGCEFEVPIIDNVLGYPFRGKADVIGQNKIADIKTTTDIKGFKYSALKYGYDVQAYLYCQLFGMHFLDFTFIVLDKGSLDIGIFEITEEFYDLGKEKVVKALQVYEEYFAGKDIMNDDFSDKLDNYYIEQKLDYEKN